DLEDVRREPLRGGREEGLDPRVLVDAAVSEGDSPVDRAGVAERSVAAGAFDDVVDIAFRIDVARRFHVGIRGGVRSIEHELPGCLASDGNGIRQLAMTEARQRRDEEAK